MPDEPTATGTTGAEPQGGGNATGTAAQPTVGGTAGDESIEAVRAERDRLKAAHEQGLREKSNSEAERRRLQDLEVENERLRQGATYQPPTGVAPEVQQLQQDFAELSERDPAVARLIARMGQLSEQSQQATRRELAYSRELDQVPAADREDILRRCKATPGLSPAWAQKDMESERYRAEKSALDERRRKLDEEEAARRRGRVDTSITPIAGSDLHNSGITAAELADLSRKAERGGTEGTKAAERLRAFDRGDLGRMRET